MVFSAAELEFLRSQRIGRFATVGPSGWPNVVPVMYSVDDEGALEFDVDGVKLRNITKEPRAAMVVDAMGPKRGDTISGTAGLIAPDPRRLAGARAPGAGSQVQLGFVTRILVAVLLVTACAASPSPPSSVAVTPTPSPAQ